MPDEPISALPVAAPITGADLGVVVASLVTSKITLQDFIDQLAQIITSSVVVTSAAGEKMRCADTAGGDNYMVFVSNIYPTVGVVGIRNGQAFFQYGGNANDFRIEGNGGALGIVTLGGMRMDSAVGFIGTASLNGTTPVTISTSAIEATSFVFLTNNSPSAAFGTPVEISANRVNGVSFDIVSNNVADTSNVVWMIVGAV